MKKFRIATAVLLAAVFGGSAAQAVIIDTNTAIPDSDVLINFNNSGVDWVYAAPIGPTEFSPLNAASADYRSAEGWRVATDEEWANRPIWSDFLMPGYTPDLVAATDGFTDHGKLRFAAKYFSDYDHVDLRDFANGNVTDGRHNAGLSVPETIYVRSTRRAQVPEPAAFGLLGLGLVGLGLSRRRLSRRA